jgi:ATP-dependent phosphofructokinase / diphosphate-dependent phosphofructokinase
MQQKVKKIAILAGGGPAPGINSVIASATIRATLSGIEVLGIKDGFRHIMEGKTDQVLPLTIEEVSRIHLRGGCFLGMARANPTKKEETLEKTVSTLLQLGVDGVITIGGDDTAYSSYRLEQHSKGSLRVVHVPKTIDNDLHLPLQGNTFGFQTARHVGAHIVRDLMTDAKTTSRWYFVVAMGRKVGHLALGIGKAAGATLTVIPEEFSGKVPLKTIVDIVLGAMLKRLAHGADDGVAVLAEGLADGIDEKDLTDAGVTFERDDHGHIRLDEINFGDILKRRIQGELKSLGIKTTIVAKNLGYELRCVDPIPFDIEYTRDLGFYAAKFLEDGGTGAVVTIELDHCKPIPLSEMLDPKTHKMAMRPVDAQSERYRVARQYMVRLTKSDFEDPHELARIASVAKMSTDDFRARFEAVVQNDPAPIKLIG